MGFRPLADCRDRSGILSNENVRCGVRLQLPAKGTVNDVNINILHIVYLFGCRSRTHHYYWLGVIVFVWILQLLSFIQEQSFGLDSVGGGFLSSSEASRESRHCVKTSLFHFSLVAIWKVRESDRKSCFWQGLDMFPPRPSSWVLGWVHTCNVTAYRNTVSWPCGRDP